MAKDYYLPVGEKQRAFWLSNFATKIVTVGPSVGVTPVEITSVGNDSAMYNYLVTVVELTITNKEQRVAHKNLIANGPIGMPGSALPPAVVLPVPPVTVAPGIMPRIIALIARIKKHPNYTEAIGKDLGIIGAEQEKDFSTMQPTLKVVMRGIEVEVQWNKAGADSVYIETDKGNGWQFLAVDSVPHYTDTTPITALALWKYRAMYIVNDQRLGPWSATASITVGEDK